MGPERCARKDGETSAERHWRWTPCLGAEEGIPREHLGNTLPNRIRKGAQQGKLKEPIESSTKTNFFSQFSGPEKTQPMKTSYYLLSPQANPQGVKIATKG